MSFRRFFAVLLVAWALGLHGGLARADSSAQVAVHTWSLDNGLRVAHVERPTTAVSVQVWYRAGSRLEPASLPGLARLFEALAHAGSTRVRPGDHRRFVNLAGGYVDGFVIEDAAAFNSTVPADQLNLALALEAARMRGLMFPGDSIIQAQRSVAEASRARAGRPFFQALRRFMALAYKTHPYRRTAEPPNRSPIPPPKVKAFYDAHYAPDNALLIVAGGVAESVAREAVDKAFGPITGAKASRVKPPAEPPQTSPRRSEVVGAAGVGFVLVGYHIPEANHPDIYALQLASLVLSRGSRSRLARRFESGKLAVSGAAAEAIVRADPGIFVAYASFGPGADVKAVEAALIRELEELGRTAVSAADLKRAFRQLEAGIVPAWDQATGLARQIGQSWVLTGDPGRFLQDLAKFRKVTPGAVRVAAKKYLHEKNRSVLIVAPAGAGRR